MFSKIDFSVSSFTDFFLKNIELIDVHGLGRYEELSLDD